MAGTSAGRAGAASACAGSNPRWLWRRRCPCAQRKSQAPSQGQPNRGSYVPGNRSDRSRIPELHSVDGSLPGPPVDLVGTAGWYSGCSGLARIGEVFFILPSAAIHRCRGRFFVGDLRSALRASPLQQRLAFFGEGRTGRCRSCIRYSSNCARRPQFPALLTCRVLEFWLIALSAYLCNVWQTRPRSQMPGHRWRGGVRMDLGVLLTSIACDRSAKSLQAWCPAERRAGPKGFEKRRKIK